MTETPCRDRVHPGVGLRTVLLVGAPDGDPLTKTLTRWTGARLTAASDLEAAFRTVRAGTPHAVVSALPLTDEQGLTLLMWMAVHHPDTPVVVIADPLTDDDAEQAQWFGARAAFARDADVEALAAEVADALDLSPAIDVWDHIAAVAGRRHLALVTTPIQVSFDADIRLTGLFRGLGQVRGLRGSVALSAEGSLLGLADMSGSLDVPETIATLQVLIEESHRASSGAGLAELETAVFRTDQETIVASCCVEATTHVHVVSIVAKDGNRALVELAHRRLRRDVQQRVDERSAAVVAS
jgi:ActR/RegA family two-component response regulator